MSHFRDFFKDWLDAIARYPGASLVSLLIAIAAVWLNHLPAPYSLDFANQSELYNILARIIASGLFTLPLMIVGPLMRQIDPLLPKRYSTLWQAGTLVLWLLFYISLPQDFNQLFWSTQLWIVLSILFARITPFGKAVHASKYDSDLIWGWSQQMLLRLAIAGLGAAIIGGWIAASLASLEYLFDVVISSTSYADVWIIVRSLFGTAIRLTHLHDNPQERSYNKIFRFFALYIFLPLAVLYALILFAYGLKILISGAWPRGMIVRMVIGYTAFGMIGYLLSYPLRKDSKRLGKVHNWYFISSLLFVILLFVAIWMRIDQYGLTAQRYLVVMIGIRIVIISWFSLFKPSKSLSVIIVAFILCLMISTFGPQSATELPQKMQYNNLVALLQTNNLLQDGHILARPIRIGTGEYLSGDLDEIYRSASYLATEEGTSIFKPLYAGTGFDQLSGTDRRLAADKFMSSLGVDNIFINRINQPYDDNQYFSFYSDPSSLNAPISLSDYTLFIIINSNQSYKSLTWSMVEFERSDKSKITLPTAQKVYTIDLHDHLAQIQQAALLQSKWWPSKALEIDTDDYKLIITEISWQQNENGEVIISNYNWFVFLK